jgi:hypothetical protein
MSWNISKPGDYINGPLTVVGVATFNTNVGIGVTPEAWTAFNPVLRIKNASTGGGGALGSTGIDNFRMLTNVYYDGQYKRIANGFVTVYEQASGSHVWYSNGTGAAGSTLIPTPTMVSDSSGNLSTYGSGNGANLNVTTSSQVCGLRLRQTQNVHPATRNWSIYTNGSAYGVLEFGVGASQFSDSYATVLTVDGAGNVTPNGNLVPAAGKGIDFSAASNVAGMTSELLNDYEEGTWTGTLKGTTADPTTAVTATGRYTKVGRVVSLQIHFDNVNTTGASGVIYVLGAPFTNGGLSTFGTAASGVGATFTGTLTSYIGNAQTNLFFVGVNSNASTSDATHNAGSGRYFWLNTTYIV